MVKQIEKRLFSKLDRDVDRLIKDCFTNVKNAQDNRMKALISCLVIQTLFDHKLVEVVKE